MSDPLAGCSAEERAIGRLFDAFNRRDFVAGLSLLHPQIVFEAVTGAVMNEGQPYIGHEGMRRYFAQVEEHWHELQVKPVQIRAAGGAVVALGDVSGKGVGGSVHKAPTTWVFKFKDGLVSHVQIFSDERLARQALEADASIAPRA
jgi:ketosteroid isomerase-like protein